MTNTLNEPRMDYISFLEYHLAIRSLLVMKRNTASKMEDFYGTQQLKPKEQITYLSAAQHYT